MSGKFGKTVIIILSAAALGVAVWLSGCAGESGGKEQIQQGTANCTLSFSCESGFYTDDQDVKIKILGKGDVHYTLDGSEPTADSPVFKGSVSLSAGGGDYPNGYCLKAAAFIGDTAVSDTYTANYICGENVNSRFSTYVICVSGAASELTEGPDGIFYGDNVYNRGRENERKVSVEIFDPTGKSLVKRNCGVRAFGGASREHFVKSMKFYTRKEYDPENKFELNIFDPSGKDIKYKRLVLRNTGNDFHFAYIRDEFLEYMAGEAGLNDHEGVAPAVLYLNGKYNGLLWLHENYCDDYFDEKYDSDGDGEFVILEGDEFVKSEEDDPEIAAEYNKTYAELCTLDLTDDDNYRKVTEFMDVENYLDYYAFNLYVCNFDWPHNNVKCYRYCPKEGTALKDGVFDGRYRYLVHDLDWSMGWDEFSDVSYDNFAQFFTPGSQMSSTLFGALMKREDSRRYLRERLEELMNGPFEPSEALEEFNGFDALRASEQVYYQKWLEENEIYAEGTPGPSEEVYLENMETIRDFLAKRPEYVKAFIDVYLK